MMLVTRFLVMRPLAHGVFSLLVAVWILQTLAVAAPPLGDAAGGVDARTLSGLAPLDGGKAWEARVQGDGSLKASFQFGQELGPGWYRLSGDYLTEKLPPFGSFGLAPRGKIVDGAPRQRLSAAAGWLPFGLVFRIAETSRPGLRLADLQGGTASTVIRLRNLGVTPLALDQPGDWLANGDFAAGRPGEIPPGWTWRYEGGPGDYELAADPTFRRGNQTMRVRNTGGRRTFEAAAVPLPASGRMTFEIWTRSTGPATRVALLLIGDDYRWQKKQEIVAGAEWQKHTLAADCPGSAVIPYAWPRIIVLDPGTVHLAGAALTWSASPGTPAPGVAARGEASTPPSPAGGQSRNRLANSGFEFGLNNWMFDVFAPDGFEASADVGASAPSEIVAGEGIGGSAAMFLAHPRVPLVSGCLPLERGAQYTLSAYVRPVRPGETLKLYLLDPGWQSYTKTFSDLPVGQWTRVVLAVRWDKPSRQNKVYARFDGSGHWIDQVQLEAGDLSPYSPPAVEAGLLAPDGNVFGPLDRPRIALKVRTDQPGPFTVELETRDAWGVVAEKRALALPAGRPESVTPLSLPGGRLGVFEVSATIKGPGGGALAHSRTRYAVVGAPGRKGAGPGLFGVCHESPYLPRWLLEREMPLHQAMGATLNRFFLKNQGFTQPEPPETYVEQLRQRIGLQIRGGLEDQIACFNNLPPSLRDRVLDREVIDEETLGLYAAYLRGIVEPLKQEIRYWEIANEPNLWRHRDGPRKGMKTMPPAKYVQLLKTAHATLRQIDPDLKVVGVCLNGTDLTYLEETLRLGAADYMDVFSFHSYRTSPDIPDSPADLAAFRRLLDRHGFTGPMMNTEQYFAANKSLLRSNDSEALRGYYLPDDQELETCARTVRNYLYHASAGVPYCAYSPQLTLFRHGGHDSFYLFYAYGAYNAASRFLSQAGKATRLDLAPALRAYCFADAPEGPLLTLNTPGDGEVATLRIEGDFAAYDMMGNEIDAGTSRKTLPLSGAPVYLRFKPGATEDEVRRAVRRADLLGVGKPFTLAVSQVDSGGVTLAISNRLNKTAQGRVKIENAPADWVLERREAGFTLPAGETQKIAFPGALSLADNADYALDVLVTADRDAFLRGALRIAPSVAREMAAVKADGDLSEWAGASWTRLGEDNLVVLGTPGLAHAGNADLSAKVAFGWNRDFFACAVVVTDDAFDAGPSHPAAWSHDSIQFYFNPLDDAVDEHHANDADDIVYLVSAAGGQPAAWVEKGAEGRYLGEANTGTGLDRDVEVAVVRDGRTTTYEIRWPRECLPQASLEKGGRMGFALLVNDNDGPGRKPGLSLTPRGTEPKGKPWLWRNLFFR